VPFKKEESMAKKSTRTSQQRPTSSVNDILSNVKSFKPLTENQRTAHHEFHQGKNLVLYGFSGTGKTYLACAFAIESLKKKDVNQIRIIRSSVPARDIGFLPGTEAEKMAVYEKPYEAIFNTLLSRGDAYDIMKQRNMIVFESSSFHRGMTYDNTFVLVDEFQNMSFEELNTIITRVGENSRIVFCGDIRQCDLEKQKSGFGTLKKVLTFLPKYFRMIEMKEDDIIRSELVRDYIITVERIKDEEYSQEIETSSSNYQRFAHFMPSSTSFCTAN
jgi:phosphate starvation-inducible protein PhoH